MTSLEAPVEIVPYDPSWLTRFREEADILRRGLAAWLAGPIEHIGSTAIPGLAAKPVIDIMAGVQGLDVSRPAIAAATELGYCYFPYQVELEHWFCKPSPSFRTHHLHLISVGTPEWSGRIAFRDYLRAHADVASEYEALKRRLAHEHRLDREAYTQAKGPFIERITKLALSFDWQPVLKGDLIELRPLRPEDHDALYAVASDPSIWEQHPDKTRHEVAGFRVFFDEALASGGALIVSDAVTHRVIGSSRFHGYDAERDEVEIGWTFLARSHWGGRYNGEMKQLMLEHAFRFVGRVVFLIGPQNLRSQRAVEKIGGVFAGSRSGAGGRESYVYQITAGAFAQQAARR